MAPPLILSMQNAAVSYGNKEVFKDLSFNIHVGNKICLIGKNGSGKTSLLKTIAGQLELDAGERWQSPGTTIGYLEQETKIIPGQTIFDFIFSALPKEKQNSESEYLVDMVATPLLLNLKATMSELSGGQLRRATLAKSLVEDPDVLLLDEPTNHLDLAGTIWLEEYLNNYRGTFLCISHDKMFLANISNKVFWLDRGIIRTCPKGFAHFEEWQDMLLEQERRELENRKRSLVIEEDWANRGVKARRKRNVRRLAEFKENREKLKSDERSFRQVNKTINYKAAKDEELVSNVIAEFYNVSKIFHSPHGERVILDKFNYRIHKGDRIGILGNNGSGKTSFLKMLLGNLEPDQGKVKLAHNLKISYFDQTRSNLNPKETVWKNLCPNGDYIKVGDKDRHVCGYLKDFLFDPKQAYDIISTLSGGQQNRLMLAKALASPGNLLILDEPTNDLDMETLEMLTEIVSLYNGTLLIVSHDRDFLEQTVNKILAFSGHGNISEHIGGYIDYQKHILAEQNEKKLEKVEKTATPKEVTKPVKISYKIQYEYQTLPEKISKLEEEIENLKAESEDPEFYQKDANHVSALLTNLAERQTELENAELRWLELDELCSNPPSS